MTNKHSRALAQVGLLAISSILSLSACAPTPQNLTTVAPSETPDATVRATQLCVINETEVPLEVRWKEAAMRNDGDKIGKYAITKSNSGKVCGLGSLSTVEIQPDVVVQVGQSVVTGVNHGFTWPSSDGWILNKDNTTACETSPNDALFSEGESNTLSCNGMTFQIERQKNTDYVNFLVTYTEVPPAG